MRSSRREAAEADASLVAPASLPPGWRWCALGDVASLQPGYAFRSDWFTGEGTRLLRGINIEPGATRWTETVFISQERSKEFVEYALAEGDIVLAMDRPIVAAGLKIARVSSGDLPCLLLQRVGRFRCSDAILPEFLHHVLQSPDFAGHLQRRATGTQLPHVSATDVHTARLALPPLADQRRIALRLDRARQHTQRARGALDAVLPLLERFRQAVLAAAFRGDLTADWRAKNPDVEPASELLKRIRTERRRRWEEAELAKMAARGKMPGDDRWKDKYFDPTPIASVPHDGLRSLPDTWCWTTLGSLGLIESGQTPAGIEHVLSTSGTVPWFRVGDMNLEGNGSKMINASVRLSAQSATEFGLHLRPAGTLVFPKRGGAIATNKKRVLAESSAYDLNIMGIVAAPSVESWFNRWFDTVDLAKLNDGAVIPQINHGDVVGLNVPLAPRDESKVILEQLDRALEHTVSASGDLEVVRALVEAVTRSMSSAIFGRD